MKKNQAPGVDQNGTEIPHASRWWTYDDFDMSWWWPFYVGADEWCNRTLVIKTGRTSAWVLALNIPLRRKACRKCLKM